MKPLIVIAGVTKTFPSKGEEVTPLRRLDLTIGEVLRNGEGQAPRRRVAVATPFRALARREPGQREPRMSRNLQRELLADHAGRAKNTNVNAIHRHK